MKKKLNLLLFIAFWVPVTVFSQDRQRTDSTTTKEIKYPVFKVKGLFQSRYIVGLHDKVDVNGMHHETDKYTNNTFDVKRVRFSTAVAISEWAEVNVLLNLADFKSDPKNKVLENAYIQYKITEDFAVILGQFRPSFGLENTFPVDIVKSMDFSNQYYEFGSNGWESFQIGAGIIGTTHISTLPVKYALTVFNGNGRNQNNDKDNGKQFAGRTVITLSKKNQFNLGLNGGYGKVFDEPVYAAGIDISGLFNLGRKFSLEFQAEAKQGTNHYRYFLIPVADRTVELKDYQVRGWYALPNLKYNVGKPRFNSIEISCRYEEMDLNYKRDSNIRRTVLPMVGFEFLKNYNSRLQLGFQMDFYEKEISNTTTYNNKLFIMQIQSRF